MRQTFHRKPDQLGCSVAFTIVGGEERSHRYWRTHDLDNAMNAAPTTQNIQPNDHHPAL